ncbi:hypothetical protein B0H14DRAFT_1200448 [Mycena olivaceomarginata]|nr:hypothetical protein B0H14DRAFT_1200448 [Mycena olivaceomarginata]
MDPVHLGQRSVVVPPLLRYCWRATTVTPSHWQMQQRRIGATNSAGEWLLPRFTAGVLCGGQGRPPAFPTVGCEGWMGTRTRYSVTLRLAQRCIGGHAAWVLVWCRGAASRRADSGVVAKGRCGTARKAHVRWNCRGQYRMCRQQSRGSGGMEHHRGAAQCSGIRGDVCTSRSWTGRGQAHCLRLCGA